MDQGRIAMHPAARHGTDHDVFIGYLGQDFVGHTAPKI
jgi:hypothetical protein